VKKVSLPKPTDAELAILRVLWRRGPSTVREVWDEMQSAQRAGYTTILKLLQIMFQKGLVKRDTTARSHVFAETLSEEQTQQQVVGHVLDRVFAGSARKLVMQALAVKKASPAELQEVRRLLDRIEGENK
jgi:BlaI family transcriptional regulator, penicillinase repressor